MESTTQKTRKFDVKKVVVLGMLAAIAYVLLVLTHSITMAPPPFSFLTYDAKDVIIVMAGFMFGPISAVLMSLVVSFIEMISISGTDWWGFVMNVLSTCSFTVTAAIIYKQNRSLKGAIIGLVSGVITVSAVMLLWNYLVTPIYMTPQGSDVAVMRNFIAENLLPIFLPYNLIKAAINATLAMLLYKPLTETLRAARLLPKTDSSVNKKATVWIYAASFVLLAALIVLALMFIGILKI